MNKENIIEITHVNKVFSDPDPFVKDPGLNALRNVSFTVRNNEFVSLVGPSGCGKSTLLKLIAGLDKEYEGTVSLCGVDVKESRVPVSYMLQKDCLLPWRTIMSNILLPVEVRKGDIKKVRQKMESLISEFGLSGFENYRPNQLSGGMRQRAALLRTYLMEGEIMLLDEPFGSLDEITRMQMQDWLIRVWEKHKKTVLFVTHDIDEAVYLSDRVLVMSTRPGTIIGDIPVTFGRPRVREMLLGTEFNGYKKRLLEMLSKTED
ncbi:MAG: ABC transporter ATP-binding protein [Clostridiaceae bacterium]|nr:ABC transporter ATP-binding protein [Clostridiaceae bacterium]